MARATKRGLPAIFLLAISLVARPLRAVPGEWSSVGPYGDGGNVHAIVLDGMHPGTIYLGTDGGVFKSVDGGASWGVVNAGLTGFRVSSLVIDPFASGTLYAGTDVGTFKTINGGNDWIAQRTGMGTQSITGLAIDPADARVLYAATAGAGVFKSTDGATTWVAATNGLSSFNVRSLAVAPASGPRTLWAGTDAGVFASGDGGTSWILSPGLSAPIRALAADPISPAVVYAGVDGAAAGVFKSSNGGTTWSSAGAGLGNRGILAIAVCQTQNSTAFAAVQGGGLYVTRDAGATWSPLAGSPATAQAIALNANGPDVYAGAADGFYRSADEGRTWQQHNGLFSTFTVNALLADPAAPNTVYAAVTRATEIGGGVFKTGDGGATWAFVGGIPDNKVMALAAASGSAPAAIYAGTNGAGIFRTRDGGASWASIDSGLTSLNVRAIATSGALVVYAGTDGGVFRSLDAGENWTAAPSPVANFNVLALAVEPGNPAVAYAGSATGLYKTTDGGTSWAVVNAGLPNVVVLSLAIDSASPSTVYAGTILPFTSGGVTGRGVYRSTDGGATWQAANDGIEDLVVTSLVCDPQGSFLYAGTTSGVYRLARGSVAWTGLNQGLEDQAIEAVLVDPRSPTVLYAGTSRNSVFKADVTAALGGCVSGPATLCLNANRFQVNVAWRVPADQTAGVGRAVPLTSDTGAFWFFTSSNVELVIKVVDGRPFNGAFWVFYGAMSDVEYTVTVTDTLTSEKKTYENPQGRLASVADTSAFPSAATAAARSISGVSPAAPPPTAPAPMAATAAGACTADSETLCLNGGRFRVQVDWTASAMGQSGRGQAAPLSSDSGSFWFFSPGNLELNIKVVDGRAVNGRFWVFYGALSDVQYAITVTDMQTGVQRSYTNPQGRLASVADTTAF